jgi:hypothetical protein
MSRIRPLVETAATTASGTVGQRRRFPVGFFRMGILSGALAGRAAVGTFSNAIAS